jgi:hypothetical protein
LFKIDLKILGRELYYKLLINNLKLCDWGE